MTQRPETDPVAEVALLRRQLERERRARRTAEQVGEQSTAQLYDAVQELEQTQAVLQQHLDDQRLVNQLSLTVRQDLDSVGILRRAVSSVGAAVGADRCLIRFADGSTIGGVAEQWVRPGVRRLGPETRIPPALEALCLAAAARRESIAIDDVRDDVRLAPADAAAVVDHLDSRAYLGTPMWMGAHLVGWLVLQSTTRPRDWTTRDQGVVEGVADALGIALVQAQAHARQSEALEQMRQVDQVRTEFVATVSHELRTPLTSISGSLQILLDPDMGRLSDDQSRLVGVVSRNTDRLLTLVEDLLALSRIDTGVAATVPLDVDMGAVVSNMQHVMAPLATSRGLELRVTCDRPFPTVSGDPDQLERMVVNVVSNALKFTPDGGTVAVSLVDDRDGVVLTVTDTGHGISPEDLPLVFDRFYRSASASERADQGTGLGLAVVKGTVEEHGGTIAITSELGTGTTVTITLPAAPVSIPGRPAAHQDA